MASGIYSVTQVNSYIKNMFTQDFLLNRISVKGEVSNCKYHGSGHIYFTVKDDGGTLAAVMFAGNRKGLAFRLADGQKVIVKGSISVYERDGRYQLYASSITLDGEGDLYLRFEKLKKELEEMGMFDASYKQPVKRYASRIGIVTAATGAAIQDIINISHRRNPYVQLILYPAAVQGEKAVPGIIRGIKKLDEMGVDTIIVGRGGGSIEDLWAFNEEAVARAVFNCRTPVISAVGHETDFTITDFVADLRAPTPSAAAELAVADINDTEEDIEEYKKRLTKALSVKLEDLKKSMDGYAVRFKYLSPKGMLNTKREYASRLYERLDAYMKHRVRDERHALMLYSERLNGLSPLLKLNQGYSYTENEMGIPVNDINSVKKGDILNINVKNGIIKSVVEGVIRSD